MATVEACEAALQDLSRQLAAVDPQARRKHVPERTVSCRVKDLDATWAGRLTAEGLEDLARADAGPAAQLKLSLSSDDLIALTRGELGFGTALASGRLRIDASVLDLIRLRSLL